MAVRLNTRVSDKTNEWLDKKSEEMAVSKSALVNFAIESYIKETEVVHNMPSLLLQLEQAGIKLDK